MKNFNWRAFQAYRYDVKVNRDDMKDYYPHVINVANSFPRDSIAIGALNIQDLIQAGNVGLVEAWAKVDWERIDKSPNPQAELWSYLKKRIKFAIRREIDNYGTTIKIPRRDIEEARKNLKGHDKILVGTFGSFFDKSRFLADIDDPAPWIAIMLEEFINDELEKHVPNVDHRNILLKFYGIGYEKHTLKGLAEIYRKSENAIKKIVFNTKNKLDTEEFKTIIENFYKN